MSKKEQDCGCQCLSVSGYNKGRCCGSAAVTKVSGIRLDATGGVRVCITHLGTIEAALLADEIICDSAKYKGYIGIHGRNKDRKGNCKCCGKSCK
jgi:hypothetical protein